ncbi:trypsin-like peptidase domain-containing protein [Streptomyces flavofungini]|uniref:trypsin-like peptidase domain-containing protein n=1 Tax=Streptomyces flavofungini TaxID=68200 RepID=UPI0034DF442E
MLRVERVAEILAAPPGGGRGRRGSGYLVAPGRVLTAAHVVEGASDLRVRFQADRPGERVVAADVRWRHPGIDIAVLDLAGIGADRRADPGDTASYGRLGEHDAAVRCTAVGFPRFKLRTESGGSSFRDAEHVHAGCAALSNRREGTLDLSVDAPPANDPGTAWDAWEGMSGAAVFSGGLLIGVVTRHHLADGPGRIAAGRVDRWAETLAPDELGTLEAVLGRALRPDALPDVLPASPRDLLQESYRAQLTDLAPRELRDRRQEIDSLVAFCGGSEPYLWVQGAPWAGKTALMAWFALHPPRGVVPVWFFVTARHAGQGDSGAYAEAVVDQLAMIAGREPVSRDASPARNGERTLLLHQAAERVHGEGGTLLLIVDGLDEDQSLLPADTATGSTAGPARSIASLLPEGLPPQVRVLVTSRPGPGIPVDVAGGHPLRGCPVLPLTANAAARHTEHEARYELRQALSGPRTQRDLVGLFTAARGPLKAGDLRALTGEPEFELRRLLDSGFGRILRPSGGGSPGSSGEESISAGRGPGYVFSHETLLAVAREEFGPDLGPYLERLRAWAAGYARDGWPDGTPAYLLLPYGRMSATLRNARDARLAVTLVTDPRRHARLRAETESDAACLAEMAAVHETVLGLGRETGTEELEALTALAVAGDLVARRNEELHLDVPAAYGRIGRVRLAVGLARSVFHPLNRAIATAKLARVLAEAGDRRAPGLAEDALDLVEGEAGGPHPHEVVTSWWNAKGIQAAALAGTGRRAEAVRLLDELPRPRTSEDAAGFARAVVLAAGGVRDAEAMSGLLRAAEDAVGGNAYAHHRAELLADLARAWADCHRPDERDRVHDALLALVARHPEDLRLPPIAAEALRATRPEAARSLARAARAAWLDPDAHGVVRGAPGVVYALVADRRMAEAEEFASARTPDVHAAGWIQQMYDWGEMSRVLAQGWAREGDAAAAWTALAPTWSSDTVDLYQGGSAAEVAGLLAASGRSTDAEAWLGTAAGVPRHVTAEALCALAVHHAADDPGRSLRLLRLAVSGFPGARRTLSAHQQDQFAELAGALASAGHPDDAERLAEALTDPAVRARGLAAVSLAVCPSDQERALRLAERALAGLPTADDLGRVPGALTAAVQALAGAGAADRVAEVLDAHATGVLSPFSDDHLRTRVHAVALLWPHAPEWAGRMADLVLHELTGQASGHGLIAELLVAVGHHDERRASAVRELLDARSPGPYPLQLDQRRQRWARFGQSEPSWVDTVLAGLVEAAADREHALRAYIDPLADEHRDKRLPAALAGTLALVRAGVGDHDAALALARQARGESERAEVLAHLAAHAACVPGDVVAVPLYEDQYDVLRVSGRLAGLLLPPPSGPDLPRARALLAQALTSGGWWHALPVLARLAPDAVLAAGRDALAELSGER